MLTTALFRIVSTLTLFTKREGNSNLPNVWVCLYSLKDGKLTLEENEHENSLHSIVMEEVQEQ